MYCSEVGSQQFEISELPKTNEETQMKNSKKTTAKESIRTEEAPKVDENATKFEVEKEKAAEPMKRGRKKNVAKESEKVAESPIASVAESRRKGNTLFESEPQNSKRNTGRTRKDRSGAEVSSKNSGQTEFSKEAKKKNDESEASEVAEEATTSVTSVCQSPATNRRAKMKPVSVAKSTELQEGTASAKVSRGKTQLLKKAVAVEMDMEEVPQGYEQIPEATPKRRRRIKGGKNDVSEKTKTSVSSDLDSVEESTSQTSMGRGRKRNAAASNTGDLVEFSF